MKKKVTKKEARNISELTLIKMLVNLKTLGYFGKCLTPLTKAERAKAVDILIERKLIDENCNLLPASKEIIINNLNLAY